MLASEVARAFALGQPRRDLVEVARGAMGVVFRLETDKGRFAVKRLFNGPTGDESANLALQLAALDAGVPLPRPLLSDDAIVAQDGSLAWWRAYEWVDGTMTPFDTPAPKDVAMSIAASLGRLHSLRHREGDEVDGWFLGASNADVVTALDVAETQGIDVAGARRWLPTLAEISRRNPTEASVGCHNDPDRTNVIVSADRSAVLVDWDNAGACYATCEFAGALYTWGYDGDDATKVATIASMVEVYRSTGARFEPTGLEVFATTCSSWVNYTLNCCEHLADPSISDETRAFEQPIIDQLPNFAVTVDKLEHILELVPA